ncbi:MAG: M20/M25/M40 family metallo-hydrolase [Clostridiales bacterium]|nr:M20/M25/M40 family metallo-hydrolase [Clostridiales bacterium]
MTVSEERAFELLKKMAFERVSGTGEERRAAEILRGEAASFGVSAEFDPFSVEDADVLRAELEVLSPFHKKYEVTGFKRSADTPDEGLAAGFLYVEDAAEALLRDARGKIVLTNDVRRNAYERIVKAGAAGVITWSGDFSDDPAHSDLNICKLRPMLTDAFGFLPAVNMRAADAIDLVRSGAETVRLTVKNRNVTRESRNVVCTIPGTDRADEEILLGGHYDSVYFSTGVYDNAAGCVVLMELMRYFKANPPRRTLKFVFFGSEEQGLLGSRHYAASHDLEKTVFMVNADVGGPVLGANKAYLTCNQDGVAYVAALLNEGGYAFEVKQSIQSSDSIPMTDAGVPCLNINRAAAHGAGVMHSRLDTVSFLSARGVANILYPALDIMKRLDGASVFPIKREIPQEVRDMVDRYLYRK